MARLTSAQRKKIPKSKFQTKIKNKPAFPLDNLGQAKSAIKLSGRSYKAGNISKTTRDKIDKKATKMLEKGGMKGGAVRYSKPKVSRKKSSVKSK